VNLASINAFRFGGHDSYSAGKAAMLSLTRTMAARYGKNGIRVNTIIPGTIVTQNWDSRIAANPRVLEELLPFYPLGRLGTSADIAKAAVFLTSANASWITGAELAVDGGYLVANTNLHEIAEGPQ
jgi:NAD(P)-dependent dehydrogenase (short-subunit alcohol dehydrogenase family)